MIIALAVLAYLVIGVLVAAVACWLTRDTELVWMRLAVWPFVLVIIALDRALHYLAIAFENIAARRHPRDWT